MRIGFLVLLVLVLSASAVPAAQAASYADPVGDNCGGSTNCGPDLTGAADNVDPDGTARLSITRAGSVCNTLSYPATEVQPYFTLFAADGATPLGAVWAVSTTSTFQWSPAGGGAEIPIASTVSAGSVEVTLPASLIASLGGLPLRWNVNDSCKEFPFLPQTDVKDFAPDTGSYTLAASVVDACPNIAGPQTSVPAGMFVDASGACIADQCANLDGGQASVPAGMFVDPSGACLADQCVNLDGGQADVPPGHVRDAAGSCWPVTVAGTAGANSLIGNALDNLMYGYGGRDRLFGRAGNDRLAGGAGNDVLHGEAGNDRLAGDGGADVGHGGAGKDVVVGGAGRDTLYGDAGNDTLNGRDGKAGDLIVGGPGTDTCHYDRGDVLRGCERKLLS